MVEPTRETPAKTVAPDAPLITPIGADGAEPNLPARKASIDEFLKRNAEVLEKDREEFQAYLVAKQAAATAAPAPQPAPARKTRMSRRTMLNVAVGTAGAAEVAVLGYGALGGGSSDTGTFQASGAGPQQSHITREIVDSRADIKGRSLGQWIALLPTKLGGGTYALDLNSNRVLASIWYWTYGDFSPISHHLCAFPSSDPYHGFEFVNSTQGGKNSLI